MRAYAGSIPACAEEPRPAGLRRRESRVYPRVCGGTTGFRRSVEPSLGLSPRVRGNPNVRRSASVPRRSIPACAGEPTSVTRRHAPPGVYPRVCGGTTGFRRSVEPSLGLSPRVRGNPNVRRSASVPRRSIPACAGEPAAAASRCAAIVVYPRVCGGTAGSACGPPARRGLSPRVRGNRWLSRRTTDETWSIPACAGEPRSARIAARQIRVYPRVCGGTSLSNASVAAPTGLSPRVRGNRPLEAPGRGSEGSIPACAGEPPVRSS